MIRQLVFVVEEADAGYLGQPLDINQISETFDNSGSESTCKTVNFSKTFKCEAMFVRTEYIHRVK